MEREYPRYPILGVGGVIFDGESVLLVKRDQEPGLGQWSLPGGVVELGEGLTEALKREIYEEVSIDIHVEGLVRLLDRIVYDQQDRIRFHYVIADYWGWMVSGQPHPATDISDILFVPLHKVQGLEIHQEVKETVLMAERMRHETLGPRVPGHRA